ncbi:hypothetical protein ACFYZJ_13895 [Streptomyces sp. NPDC001848]|uniref:hypothetical protein n=1 Tax=Streptomyces sp. NPDC001848 TaxID=3364618 RepID=UPI0036C89B05
MGGQAPYWKSYETDVIGNRVSDTTHDTGLNATKDITRSYEYGTAGALGDGPHQVTKVVEKTPTGEKQSTYEYDDAGNGLAGKILATYGAPWKWAKGVKLAKRVTCLVGDLIGGVKSLWKANKAVGKARAGLAKAADKLADARRKAAEAPSLLGGVRAGLDQGR